MDFPRGKLAAVIGRVHNNTACPSVHPLPQLLSRLNPFSMLEPSREESVPTDLHRRISSENIPGTGTENVFRINVDLVLPIIDRFFIRLTRSYVLRD